jgi:RimJ/RimL family protein N-acetyltransferase
MTDVRIREVADADLPIFYEHQCDPQALRMAVWTARDQNAFADHWARIRVDRTVMIRTILAGEAVAGYIGSWVDGNERRVAYWLGREWWGKGIATRALAQLLAEVAGTVFARVASTNVASRRVLEKCGFIAVETQREGDVEEIVMRLDR